MWAGTTNLVNKPDPQPTVEQEEEESGKKNEGASKCGQCVIS